MDAKQIVDRWLGTAQHPQDVLMARKVDAFPALVEIRDHWKSLVEEYIRANAGAFSRSMVRESFRKQCWDELCQRMMAEVQSDFFEDERPRRDTEDA